MGLCREKIDAGEGWRKFLNTNLHHFISRLHLMVDAFSASGDGQPTFEGFSSCVNRYFVGPAGSAPLWTPKAIEDFMSQLLDSAATSNVLALEKMKGLVGSISAYKEDTSDNLEDEITKTSNQAQQLDYYYSNLVRGAAVGVSISRVWTSAERPGPGKLDDAMFSDIAWDIIQKLKPEWTMQGRIAVLRGMSAETEGQQMVSLVRRMRDLRDAMVAVWDESRRYRVSDEVHVIEVQVLSRLKRDGLIQWFDEVSSSPRLTVLETCNWFRRHESVRNQFAMTVGKRLATESMVSTNRSSIMNHQRTTNWSEREYAALHEKISSLEPFLAEQLVSSGSLDKNSLFFLDYLSIQTKNEHRERLRDAESRMRWRR